MPEQSFYRGRFAPSPTGALHLGSAVAAVASFLDARANQGLWLLRIDDLDVARAVPGVTDSFLFDLERLGLQWDEKPTLQSTRADYYQAALNQLRQTKHCYPCSCSRQALVNGRYPGICREGLAPGKTARSLRVQAPQRATWLDDLVQGRYEQNIQAQIGDFVVLRADGVVAYHLATVVDDADARITRVVRGADLLDSTPRQILLQNLLGLDTPEYAHISVVVDERGRKLSKQTFARPISQWTAPAALRSVLQFLDIPPPADLQQAPVQILIEWAIGQWRLEQLPKRRTRKVRGLDLLHPSNDGEHPCS